MAVLEVPDEESFDRDVLRADEPTVVAFWAEWCPHCRRFRPLFESASSARRERFAIIRLDQDDNPLFIPEPRRLEPRFARTRREPVDERLPEDAEFSLERILQHAVDRAPGLFELILGAHGGILADLPGARRTPARSSLVNPEKQCARCII